MNLGSPDIVTPVWNKAQDRYLFEVQRSYELGSKYRPGYNYKDTTLVLKDLAACCSLDAWAVSLNTCTSQNEERQVEAASWRLGCRAGEHGRADPQTWLILRSTRGGADKDAEPPSPGGCLCFWSWNEGQGIVCFKPPGDSDNYPGLGIPELRHGGTLPARHFWD